MNKSKTNRANIIMFGVMGTIVVIGLIILFVLSGNNGSDESAVNAVTATELAQKIDEQEETVVYFYQTGCKYCEQVKPYLYPMLEENKSYSIDLAQHDVWSTYNIQGTPTLIRFKNGQEAERIEGAVPEEQYKTFFEGVK